MLCRRCEAIAERSPRTPPRAVEQGGGVEAVRNRLRALVCERCGLVLPLGGGDTTDSLLDKLSQLAQFGLTAEGRPLLESSRESD